MPERALVLVQLAAVRPPAHREFARTGARHRNLARLAVAPVVVALGVLEEMQGERARAAQRYAEALAARSPALEARWRLAALRLEEERFAEADGLLDDLPADALRQPEVAVRLAVAEGGAGRIDAALRRLEASGVEPEAALAAIDRAITAAGGADPERLLELRRRAADRLRRAP